MPRIILSILLLAQAAAPALAMPALSQDQQNLLQQAQQSGLMSDQFQTPSLGQQSAPGGQFQSQLQSRFSGQSQLQGQPQPVPQRQPLPPEVSQYELFVSSNGGPNISQFGYDFFNNPPSTFAPADNVPVTPDYAVAPGDGLELTLTGRVQGNWDLTVNRDGAVDIPRVGPVPVAGTQFKDLKDVLTRAVGRYYTGFNLDVSMGRLRSIRVYVVGEARVPGAYTVSSLATMVNALFAAGGPSKTGTMRDIELKRNGKLVSTLDLYDLLLDGDKSKDARLVNEDVIFIPPVGPLAGISGDVKRPGIYELSGETRLTDLIAMAGGFTTTAFRGRVGMQRIVDHRFRDYFNGDLADIKTDPQKNIPLRDGDLVSVQPIFDKDTAVSVDGAVAYPGKYGVQAGVTTLADIIKLSGGLLDYASDDAEITRVRLSTSGVVTTRFDADLAPIKSGAEPVPFYMQPNDHVMVKPIPDHTLYTMVKVSGEVLYPGTYPVQQGERLSSVLARAGGFSPRAYPQGVVFIRKSAQAQQQKNLDEIAQRLQKELLVEGSSGAQTALSPDEVAANKAATEAKQKFVDTIKNLKAQGRVYIKLTTLRALKGSPYDIQLEEGDAITIPQRSNVVNVTGAVMAQGSYVYDKHSYRSYVKMAGGYADYAQPGKTFILRADGSASPTHNNLFWSTRVGPGDTVVVPEQFDRVAWLREVRDISQILVNVALMAGVVIKVF